MKNARWPFHCAVTNTSVYGADGGFLAGESAVTVAPLSTDEHPIHEYNFNIHRVINIYIYLF